MYDRCEAALGEFLQGISKQKYSNVDYPAMVNILITHCQPKDTSHGMRCMRFGHCVRWVALALIFWVVFCQYSSWLGKPQHRELVPVAESVVLPVVYVQLSGSCFFLWFCSRPASLFGVGCWQCLLWYSQESGYGSPFLGITSPYSLAFTSCTGWCSNCIYCEKCPFKHPHRTYCFTLSYWIFISDIVSLSAMLRTKEKWCSGQKQLLFMRVRMPQARTL